MGNNFLRLKEPQTATAFLFKANQILERCFGDEHPVIQKYYSYSAEVGSQTDNNDMMMQMSEKLYQIVESSNQSKDGKLSLFLLDPLLTQVSIYCQVQNKGKEMDEDIETMETICA